MKTVFSIFFRDIKRLCSNWVAVLVVLGVCLIPSLYAWFNIAANMDPYSNTQGIKIAVANCDLGAENEMTGTLRVGDQIIENLRQNDALGWTFMDRQSAISGVQAGDYYAAIVIPENFSEDLVSVLSGNLESPEIEYYLNEKKNAIAPKVTDTGATTVQQQVNQTFVAVASEAVSRLLVETVFEVSQNLSKTNRKAAANVHEAAQPGTGEKPAACRAPDGNRTGYPRGYRTRASKIETCGSQQREHPNAEHRYADRGQTGDPRVFHPHRRRFDTRGRAADAGGNYRR